MEYRIRMPHITKLEAKIFKEYKICFHNLNMRLIQQDIFHAEGRKGQGGSYDLGLSRYCPILI